MTYRGLTWDHPRGYQALRAAAKLAAAQPGGPEIAWDVQPLEGFEAAPITELAAKYDLLVLDHPHVGEAVTEKCLQPLESLFDGAVLKEVADATIGPSLASYHFYGKHWALPLDAATQVMAAREDLLDDPLPTTWDAVVALSERHPVTLSLAGPHAALSFQSIATAMGEPPAEADPDRFVSAETGTAVLDLMATLAGRMPAATRDCNPIAILEHMARHDDVALCPLVYGYVNYATAADGHRALRFGDAPRMQSGGRPGSTIGGTGIGITARCNVSAALIRHLKWLMSAEAQRDFIPAEAGQPSRRDAWQDDGVNARHGNFYRDTAETMERGFVRPRHNGAIAFQTTASALIRDGLLTRRHDDILDDITRAYAFSRARN